MSSVHNYHLLCSLQVKNKPYEPTGENVFILENGAVANTSNDWNSEHKHIMFGIAGLVLGGGRNIVVPDHGGGRRK